MAAILRNFVAAIVIVLIAVNCGAHGLGISVVRLDEREDHQFLLQWEPSAALAKQDLSVKFDFSDNCTYSAPLLRCAGLAASALKVSGVPPHSDLILAIRSRDGRQAFVNFNQQKVNFSIVQPAMSATRTAIDYTALGVEHILLGVDHLLFVLALIIIVRFNKKLLWTITAFTFAHSITISLSVLNLINIPIAGVEAVIALSIVLAFREALQTETSFTRQYPWGIAFGFGLIHGLGFASALSDIGLPATHKTLALIGFNLGVELGQLVAIGSVYALTRIALYLSVGFRHQLLRSVCYLAGGIATYWALERSLGVFS